ncbi:hypothetical protein AS156_14445 [Bradyrhizobium macuxiense]|uniref:Uncharacterized protein n=1 Tax=Bradyrhizobium macuxiense TaxID=1755647 RepID=A0A109JK15_9BRAD|nr:hypothetical protein [Bradyrhizobium macuxiense]KWV50200.1 hypothetical protein AS156_14445 [Bradyrhizobium macuxiense]
MRIIAAALLLTTFIAGPVLIARPALAQDHVQRYREEIDKSPADEANEKRAQRAYQRAINSVPDQKPTDPWGIARSDSTPKAAPKEHAKSAAKRAAPKQAKPASAAAN